MAESDAAVISSSPAGLSYNDVVEHKRGGSRIATFVPPDDADVVDAPSFMAKLPDLAPRSILVDCTAVASTTAPMVAWVASGGAVVLANKKPLTGPQADFEKLVAKSGDTCGYESTVGAGTPFVASLRRLVAAGDTVRSVTGTFSGTLGFLMAGLQKGKSGWGALVNEAHELGYTEPDPRDDLSGTDVARKALIMSRTLGWTFEMDQIDVEPLFPRALSEVSVADFKKQISSMDADMAARREAAMAEGKVLRYVANCSPAGLKVGLQAVDTGSPLGLLDGPDNMMVVDSLLYTDRPLVVQGAGAGDDITAAGVVADMVHLAATKRIQG